MESKLITVREAAQLKGLSRATVYSAIKDGCLPAQQVLGRVALKESDVLEWIPVSHSGKRQSPPMSEEVKRRISQSQKERWLKLKSQIRDA